MLYVKEPYGVDFVVENTPVTEEDRKLISEIIAYYKATGKKKSLKKGVNNTLEKKTSKKKVVPAKTKTV